MKINPEQLMTFSVVAEYGSVSRAAEALNLSQSTVSGQLAALHEQVGQPLYKREGRGVTLTPAGEALLPYAHSVARSVRHAAQHIQGTRDRPTRTLKVGISPLLARWAARMMVESVRNGHPIRLFPGNSSEMQRAVELSELDAALLINPVSLATDRMDTHLLGEDELRLIVPPNHALARQESVPLSALKGEILLSAHACSSVRLQTERLLDVAGLADIPTLDVGSYCSIRDGLLDGYGVSIMPAFYLQREIDNGQLAAPRLESPYTALTYMLLTAPLATLGPAMRAFTQFLLSLKPQLQSQARSP